MQRQKAKELTKAGDCGTVVERTLSEEKEEEGREGQRQEQILFLSLAEGWSATSPKTVGVR